MTVNGDRKFTEGILEAKAVHLQQVADLLGELNYSTAEMSANAVLDRGRIEHSNGSGTLKRTF